ncbi:uncharacterized protein LOC105442203 [Strongylocentrotus purpuratus]|uniref:Uncharacterized protein n=1 Tax=Strongylocentrotus purpuratus TaxID=7668 RepID=A0A7M7HKC9_STRPU|nr:uncharacterized protein LOC105442203 [Strongylocentrotus purpuratus]
MSKQTKEQIIHALVTSRLDCCNALLVGVPSSAFSRLQRVHHNAARVLTKTGKYARISHILRQLHWLPVKRSIVFKICLTTFKFLHGQAPQYLSEMVSVTQSVRSLRSSEATRLVVPMTRTVTYGDRTFTKVAPLELSSFSS